MTLFMSYFNWCFLPYVEHNGIGIQAHPFSLNPNRVFILYLKDIKNEGNKMC